MSIMKKQMLGEASIQFEEPVYLLESASVVGTKEGQGPLADYFDMVGTDDMFGADSWEEAESTLQKNAVYLALKKAGYKQEDISFIFAGDLLGQSIASAFGIASFQIPFLGVYGACSTCGESMAIGAMTIAGGYADRVVCVTSSHFASAEKEFRFPLEYGNQRPLSSTWTVTGSGAFVLVSGEALKDKQAAEKTVTEEKNGKKVIPDAQAGLPIVPKAVIKGITVGRIVDYGLKDSMNMGACMAPAAADTIERHLHDFGRTVLDYDRIITGDLGNVGKTILYDLLNKKGIDLGERYSDCGLLIFDNEAQDTNSGGSGCGCCAVTLSAYLLKLLNEKWRRILFVPTGALLSKTSFNEGNSVPGIAHALCLERVD